MGLSKLLLCKSKAGGSSDATLPSSLRWIPANFTWSKIKPVIRCSIAASLAVILFVIPTVELVMGQVCEVKFSVLIEEPIPSRLVS